MPVIVTSHREPERSVTLAKVFGKRAWQWIDETVELWDGEPIPAEPLELTPPISEPRAAPTAGVLIATC